MLYFGVRPTLRQCGFPPEIVHELTNDQLILIFDCLVFKGWSVGKVSHDLKVTRAAVYLAKHRVSKLIKKEVMRLESAAVAAGPWVE